MEARGGCGYIEDFSDARLLRDAHLGSIWEGTSNIVALDVLRAVRRENSLAILLTHLESLLNDSKADAALAADLRAAMRRAAALVEAALAADGETLARRAASALYHLTSAVAMFWEADRIGRGERLHLARLVLTHRLMPIDPLEPRSSEADLAAEDALLEH